MLHHLISKKLKLLLFSFVLLLGHKATAEPSGIAGKLDQVRPAIVTISTSAVEPLVKNNISDSWFGTGAIVDKKLGLILTNKHVSGGPGIFECELRLYNGRKIEATQIYYDKTSDIAVLKVDPKELADLRELRLAKKDLQVSDPIFIVSSSSGQDFSIHDGIVSDDSELLNVPASQIVVASLNTRGGSSGAPVLNSNCEIIALNFGTDGSYSVSIHRKYLDHILEAVRRNKQPERRTIGVALNHINVSDASKYLKLPEAQCAEYMKKYPKSKGRLLSISYAVKGFPAYGLLNAGDIIWKVNDTLLGPEVKDLDCAIDDATESRPLKLTVFRDEKFIDVVVTPETLEDYSVKEIINFAGASFFEADAMVSLRVGIPRGRVLFKPSLRDCSPIVNPILERCGGKLKFFCFELLEIGGESVNSLLDLKRLLPKAKALKKFTLTYRLVGPLFLDNNLAHEMLSLDISLPTFVADVDVSSEEIEIIVKTLNTNGSWSSNKLLE